MYMYEWTYICVTFINMCLSVYACMQAGNYYLYNGGTANNCPFAPCSNALLGQKYILGHALRKGATCPTEDCLKKPTPGLRFSSAGSCNFTNCPSAKRGTYYTQGCDVGPCTNGNVR